MSRTTSFSLLVFGSALLLLILSIHYTSLLPEQFTKSVISVETFHFSKTESPHKDASTEEESIQSGNSKAIMKILQETEVVYEVPSNPKGAVFFAHGCNHKATHFWDFGPQCIDCIGFPEDSALTRFTVANGYAVVAVSSFDKCWDVDWPAELSAEATRVANILKGWREIHHLTSLPFHAFGASSGGYFISILAHLVEFDSLVVMISSGVSMAFKTELMSGKPYPPSLFVHMPKDENTEAGVRHSLKLLKEKKVEAAELLCKELKVTPSFFSNRIPAFSMETSKNLYQVLNTSGMLTEENYLTTDGRSIKWYDLLEKNNILPETLLAKRLKPFVDEELNLAFAYHELSSENASQIVEWFAGVCSQGGKIVNHRCSSYF